jgi:hypothetical protein
MLLIHTIKVLSDYLLLEKISLLWNRDPPLKLHLIAISSLLLESKTKKPKRNKRKRLKRVFKESFRIRMVRGILSYSQLFLNIRIKWKSSREHKLCLKLVKLRRKLNQNKHLNNWIV